MYLLGATALPTPYWPGPSSFENAAAVNSMRNVLIGWPQNRQNNPGGRSQL